MHQTSNDFPQFLKTSSHWLMMASTSFIIVYYVFMFVLLTVALCLKSSGISVTPLPEVFLCATADLNLIFQIRYQVTQKCITKSQSREVPLKKQNKNEIKVSPIH